MQQLAHGLNPHVEHLADLLCVEVGSQIFLGMKWRFEPRPRRRLRHCWIGVGESFFSDSGNRGAFREQNRLSALMSKDCILCMYLFW